MSPNCLHIDGRLKGVRVRKSYVSVILLPYRYSRLLKILKYLISKSSVAKV